MEKKFWSLMLTCIFLFTLQLVGQNTNYPTKKINGASFYVYTVKQSEGLLAIGRKFEVAADEIIKANPELKSGLKTGQEILIPVNKKTTSTEFIKHTVEKKQTLFAISHKYKVSQADIEKFNPDVKTGLKEGMILNIPDSAKIKYQKPIEKPQSAPKLKPLLLEQPQYVTHKVLPKETLYSICKQYNVDIKEVVKLNSGADIKISVDSELKIPVSSKQNNSSTKPIQSKETVSTTKTKENSEQVSKPLAAEVKAPEKSIVIEHTTESKTIKLAFLLPFMLEQSKKDAVLERFQNFYAGALLAVQAAKERGISFEIYTYDTDKTEDKMTEVLNNEELKSVDLIIGPAFSNQISLMSNFAKENKVNTLIPFSSKIPDIESNPYIFQFNPGFETELKYLIDQLNEKLKNTHVVFAEIQGVSPLDDGKIREGALKSQLIKQKRTYGTVELNSPENTDFNSQIKAGEKNLIIFNTDKFSNVSPYLNAINTIAEGNNIVLFEQYSWRNQLDKKINCMYISAFIATPNLDQLAEYNSVFNQFYGKDVSNESPRYDILGFDLTNYFISYINRYAGKYATKIGTLNSIPYLQTELSFERNSKESGLVNQTLYTGEIKAH
ncbi:MAG: LysM peptidoglycan-binding domain-containing protein [Paludibacter sp.]